MEVAKVLERIFGEYPSYIANLDHSQFTLEEHFRQLRGWLSVHLQEPESSARRKERSTRRGCLGPALKAFDMRGDKANTVNVATDWLTIQSQSAFATIRANCCVFRGKWMYEVQLRSKGIMQIGWCSHGCRFTQDTGVGDTRHSYGWDGSKQRLWHVQTRKYGPFWRSGDLIGVCVDMDAGRIEYHRNGVALGEAFADIERGAGVALFPAVSLAYNDSITANFGGSPFRHPVPGYAALQVPPKEELLNADWLLTHLVALAALIAAMRRREAMAMASTGSQPSTVAVHMMVANLLLMPLAKLLRNVYVLEDQFAAFVKRMCETQAGQSAAALPGDSGSTLDAFLGLMWGYLDTRDTKQFLGRYVVYLSSVYRETPADLEYEQQREVIAILTALCRHRETRRYLLDNRFYKKHCLPVFVYIKPPDELTLTQLLPDAQIWTRGIGGDRGPYLAACQRLERSTDVLYAQQRELIALLLRNDDDEGERMASSRKVFVAKMRQYVTENCTENRFSDTMVGSTTQPAVALSFLCIILDVVGEMFKSDAIADDFVRPENFYNGQLTYANYDRLGGVMTYLTKTYNKELHERLGAQSTATAGPAATAVEGLAGDIAVTSEISIYTAMVLISGANTSQLSLPDDEADEAEPSNPPASATTPASTTSAPSLSNPAALQVQPAVAQQPLLSPALATATGNGPIDGRASLDCMLDSCIMYYYAVAHKYVVMIAELRDNIGMLSDILLETDAACRDLDEDRQRLDEVGEQGGNSMIGDLSSKYAMRKQVFVTRSLELARKQVWYRAVALGARRQRLLDWMLHGVFRTLTAATSDGPLFSFVPELYVTVLPMLLDASLDFGNHDLATEYNQTRTVHATLQIGAEFVSAHVADTRIILAACRDAMLQAVGTLACHAAGVRALEAASPQAQRTMILGLLRPYENRAWGQSNWLLIRFWLGDGFAFRDARAPSVWQSAEQMVPEGLERSRGNCDSHTGLLHHVAPSCPSRHFQAAVGDALVADEPFATKFLNSILSQLNWAFSEFVLLLQEIVSTALRLDQRQLSESRSLKICAMCFELSVSLMRSLEMLVNIAPAIFLDAQRPNSDLLLNRACQLVSQVLARVTTPPGVFQQVVDMCLPDLMAITHFAIVTPALGILLALMRDDLLEAAKSRLSNSSSSPGMKPTIHRGSIGSTTSDGAGHVLLSISRVSRILLTDPSFQLAHLEFTVGEHQAKSMMDSGGEQAATQALSDLPKAPQAPKGNFDPQQRAHIDPLTNEVRVTGQRSRLPDQPILRFNLGDYASHVSRAELRQVQQLTELLRKHHTIISDVTLPSDDSICPICYSKSVSAVFEPCHHQSCANCIVQHLMNNKVCFYCKAHITKVENFEGVSIYECLATEPTPPIVLD